MQIVGIIASVQQRRAGWGTFGPVAAVPNVYVPVAQFGDATLRPVHRWFSPGWIVRSERPSADIVAGVSEALILMSLVATAVPALRILRLNPSETLRAE